MPDSGDTWRRGHSRVDTSGNRVDREREPQPKKLPGALPGILLPRYFLLTNAWNCVTSSTMPTLLVCGGWATT